MKAMDKKKFYFGSKDKTIYVQSSKIVDLEWLKINLGKDMTQLKQKPNIITHIVVDPDFKVHWVRTIKKYEKTFYVV